MGGAHPRDSDVRSLQDGSGDDTLAPLARSRRGATALPRPDRRLYTRLQVRGLRIPAAAVDVTLAMDGLRCDEYTSALEAVVNAVLAAAIGGADEDDFGDHECTDVARRRRGLLTSSISVTTTATVDARAYGGGAAAVAQSVAATLAAAASDGSLAASVAAEAAAAGVSVIVSITGAAAHGAPTAAPTAAAPTPAPVLPLALGGASACLPSPWVAAVLLGTTVGMTGSLWW